MNREFLDALYRHLRKMEDIHHSYCKVQDFNSPEAAALCHARAQEWGKAVQMADELLNDYIAIHIN